MRDDNPEHLLKVGPYPDNRGATHWDGCWQSRGHHNCAVARVRELEAERDELEQLKQERDQLKAYIKSAGQMVEGATEDLARGHASRRGRREETS